MAIEVQCSGCAKRYRVDDKLAGKRLKCKACGEVLVVPMPDLNDDNNDLSDLTALEGTAQSSDTVAAAAIPAAAGGEDEDDPFSQQARQPAYEGPPPSGFLAYFADARRRFEPRPNRHFTYPFAEEIDQWLPWALIVFVILPVLYQGIMHAVESTTPWVIITQIFVLLIAYVLLVVPIALKGVRVAGDGMKFQLPEGAFGKAIAVFSIPLVLGAVFYMNWNAAAVGFFLGLPVTFALIWLLFRLQWPEAIAASITSGLFFLAASVGAILITQGAGMGMEMVVAETTEVAEQPKPTAPTVIPDVVVPPVDSLGGTTQPVGDLTTQPVALTPPNPETSIEKPVPTGGPTPGVFDTPPTGTGTDAVSTNVPPAPIPNVEKTPEPPVPNIEGPNGAALNLQKSPIVAKVSSAPGLEKFDEVLYAPRDATKVATVTRTPPNEVSIKAWDLKELKPTGESTFRTDQGVTESSVLSPAGEVLRVTNWPRLMAQAFSLQGNQVTKQFQLEANQGTPQLLSFINPDVFVIKWEKMGDVGIEVWDAKANKVLKQFMILRTSENGIALSPDGKYVAFVHRTNQNGQPELMLVEVNNPARRRKFNVAGLDPRWPIDPAGVAFSSDSTRIAVLFERNGNLLVSSWTVANGKQQPDQIYGMGQLPVNPLGFTDRALDWVADDTAWLLYGNAVVDAFSGKLIGELGVDKAVSQRVLDEDTVHVVCKPSGNDKALAIIDLDMKKVSELRDQIRKAQ